MNEPGEFKARIAAERREEYLQNQAAVQFGPVVHTLRIPLVVRIVSGAAALLALAVYVYLSVLNEIPPGDAGLPLPFVITAAVSICVWAAVIPVLWESSSHRRRVGAIAALVVATVAISPLIAALFVDLGGLIAPLFYWTTG